MNTANATYGSEQRESRMRNAIKKLTGNSGFVVGAALFSVSLVAMLVGVLFMEVPSLNGAIRLKPPSTDYLMGTDNLGRELLPRVLLGAKISLSIGLSVAILATLIGTAIGLIAGFFRAADILIMRFIDGMMAIPGILLAIALVAVAGSSMINVILAITLTDIPGVVRLVRSMVLSLRSETFVDAARMAGNSTFRIVFRHILPKTFGPLAVQATFICTSAIITEALLSFIGVGTPPDVPSWGNIIAEGRNYFRIAPWIVLIPGFFIAFTVLGINLMGDALRDVLDPRHASADT